MEYLKGLGVWCGVHMRSGSEWSTVNDRLWQERRKTNWALSNVFSSFQSVITFSCKFRKWSEWERTARLQRPPQVKEKSWKYIVINSLLARENRWTHSVLFHSFLIHFSDQFQRHQTTEHWSKRNARFARNNYHNSLEKKEKNSTLQLQKKKKATSLKSSLSLNTKWDHVRVGKKRVTFNTIHRK